MSILENNTTSDEVAEPPACPNCEYNIHVLNEAVTTADDEEACVRCTEDCDWCGNRHLEENMRSSNGETTCEECRDTYSVTCDRCDRVYHQDSSSMNYLDDGNTNICENCLWRHNHHDCDSNGLVSGLMEDCDDCAYDEDDGGDEDDVHNLLHEYMYKPRAVFHPSTNPKALFMGIELETTTSSGDWHDSARWIRSNIDANHAYLKKDGSLRGMGFEIVTHPMTLEWASENFDWSFLRTLANQGMRAWTRDECGLHIHLSRAAFSSPTHIGKFLQFIYRNEGSLVQFVGRSSPDYAAFSSYERSEFVKRAKGESSGNRFVAVNCENRDTIELRIFRPSLQPTTVQAYMEFCDSLFHYTKDIPCSRMVSGGLSFDDYREWLWGKTQYKRAIDRINDRVKKINSDI